MDWIYKLLEYDIKFGASVHIKVKAILVVIMVFIITAIIMRYIKKAFTKNIEEEERSRFGTVFNFIKYLIYVIVVFITMQNMGVRLTGILAASAALLVGIGFALQTFFQDIISGIFILVDKSVHVNDIIEIDGKIGRIEDIKLRTTRAITIDNKVLIIPNHKYLTSILFNWTANGEITRESVEIGVAYGSDVELVKKVLIEAANLHKDILKDPPPTVLFTDFSDSALNFKLIFTLDNSFEAIFTESDLRFKINALFKENNIKIPFPQRDVHLYQN